MFLYAAFRFIRGPFWICRSSIYNDLWLIYGHLCLITY